MAKMAFSMTGANLSPNQAMAGVSLLDHIFRLERPGEARPARVTVKLVERSKQRLARHDIHVNTRLFVVPKVVIKRRFCCVTLRHLVLLGRKAGYGFRILVILRHLITYPLRPKSGQVTLGHRHSTARVSKRPTDESAACLRARYCADPAWLDLDLAHTKR